MTTRYADATIRIVDHGPTVTIHHKPSPTQSPISWDMAKGGNGRPCPYEKARQIAGRHERYGDFVERIGF